MSATWQKNEVTAVKRRCGMLIRKNDGSMAPRDFDFIGEGLVFVCGTDSPHFSNASGTMTNQRRRQSFDSDPTVEAVDDVTNDTLQITGHLFEIGDGPVQVYSSGTIPAGLAALTDYWVIVFDVDNIQLAASLADAYAGTFINLTSAGSGTIKIDVTGVGTMRGIDGHFIYEATQAETNHDAPETIVIVDGGNGSDYDRDLDGGAYTTADMLDSVAAFEQTGEGANTYGDLLRIVARTLAAKFSLTGNDYVFRDLADTKDSHHGTVTTAGRIDAGIDDPT